MFNRPFLRFITCRIDPFLVITYSDLANQAPGAKNASDESLAKVIVMEERKRLGINESDLEVHITDEEEEN